MLYILINVIPPALFMRCYLLLYEYNIISNNNNNNDDDDDDDDDNNYYDHPTLWREPVSTKPQYIYIKFGRK